MKNIIATLFAILITMFAVSMPVHAEWQPFETDGMGIEAIYVENDEAFNARLIVYCIGKKSIIETDILGDFDESHTPIVKLLGRVDKRPNFTIQTKQVSDTQVYVPGIRTMFSKPTLSGTQWGNVLRIRLNNRDGSQTVAKFNISDYRKSFLLHCRGLNEDGLPVKDKDGLPIKERKWIWQQ